MEEQKCWAYAQHLPVSGGATMDDRGIIARGTFVEELFLLPCRLHQ